MRVTKKGWGGPTLTREITRPMPPAKNSSASQGTMLRRCGRPPSDPN